MSLDLMEARQALTRGRKLLGGVKQSGLAIEVRLHRLDLWVIFCRGSAGGLALLPPVRVVAPPAPRRVVLGGIEARRIVGDSLILGKTTHNLMQAREAISEGADYISVGPVYATPTKPGRPAVGLQYVREAAENVDIPFVAIGGIDLSNIRDVLSAGARTIGIVRAWKDAGELLALIKGKEA